MSAVRRTTSLLVLVTTVLVLVSACGKSAPATPPGTRLATAKTLLDKTPGVAVDLATAQLPTGVDGLLSAQGTGTHTPPAFTGTIRVMNAGFPIQAAVIGVDGKTFVQIGSWSVIDPAKFGAPDPAALFGDRGLSQLLTGVQDLKAGPDTRNGSQILSTITGTLTGRAVASVIPSAVASSTFKATYTLDSDSRLQQVVISGPFYPRAPDVTYTIAFSNYGAHPRITAPPTK